MFSIETTYDCDMHCPWCLVNKPKSGNGILPPEVFEKLMCEIVTHPREGYCFQGGEPLLYPDALFEMADHLRAMQPECRLALFTNATHLTRSIVEALNFRNIYTTVSLSAEGYKGLKNLLFKAKEPFHIFENIRRLKNKSIRIVYARKQEFAVDAIWLSNTFPRVRIEITPDYLTLNKWNESDIVFFRKEVYQLKTLAQGNSEFFALMQGFIWKCDKPSVEFFQFDTQDIQVICDRDSRPKRGCARFARGLSNELYADYQKIVAYFEKGENRNV